MDELIYPSLEYEQLFTVTDEKATESEMFDAQNYGDIFRIKGTEPPLLFKKIELECFDDLQSVLNEQVGLKIFDPNCQVSTARIPSSVHIFIPQQSADRILLFFWPKSLKICPFVIVSLSFSFTLEQKWNTTTMETKSSISHRD